MSQRGEESNSVAKRLENQVAAGSRITETIVNLLKAGLATAPFCGGIASLMTDYIPSSRLVRLEKFATQIAEDLERLQGKIREECIHTDDFAFMFEKCFRGAAENYQLEKLDAFRGILINSAIDEDVPAEEKEYFVNLVNNLSVVHMRMLKFMVNPESYLQAQGIHRNQIRGGFSTFFPTAIPGVSLSIIKAAFADLYRYGLTKTDASIFTTGTAGQGLELLGDRVSTFGKQFIGFCVSPS
jgi:hypothetical protein